MSLPAELRLSRVTTAILNSARKSAPPRSSPLEITDVGGCNIAELLSMELTLGVALTALSRPEAVEPTVAPPKMSGGSGLLLAKRTGTAVCAGGGVEVAVAAVGIVAALMAFTTDPAPA
jgi:hypothetical protein